jgi:hypothetical protein
MRKILIFLVFINLIFAYDMNELLKIEAKLYPKIINLEKNIDPINLKIALIYNDSKKIAKKLSKLLQKQNISTYIANTKENIPECNAYILTTKVDAEYFYKLLQKNKLIFTVYPNYAKFTMIGIYLGIKVKPLINPKWIKKANIKLNPIIFRVSEVVDE